MPKNVAAEKLEVAEPIVKKVIVNAHPYVQQAFEATQPLIAQAIDATQPYGVYVAPYYEKAKAVVEGNEYAQKIISTTTDVFTGAKNYYDETVGNEVTESVVGSVGDLGQD